MASPYRMTGIMPLLAKKLMRFLEKTLVALRLGWSDYVLMGLLSLALMRSFQSVLTLGLGHSNGQVFG
jgi:hypothetical protein